MTNSPIAILGYGQTKFGELWDQSLEGLLRQAIESSLQDAKLSATEIDAVYVANMASGNYEFQMHLNSMVSSFFPHHPPAFRLEAACASGGLAVVSAIHGLRSQAYRKVVVVGAEKMTDVSTSTATKILAGAASSTAEYGSTFPALYALLAKLYCSRYHLKPELLRQAMSIISSRAHENAKSNPYAQFQKSISPSLISASPLVADPLRLLDCSPLSDGAAAIILTLDPGKKSYPHLPHLIGYGHAQDSLDIASRTNLPHLSATSRASIEAFNHTHLSPKDISVIELHDCFTIAEILAIEDLALLPYGTAAKHLTKHGNYKSGLIINPSGGLKACGHPVGATGVKQIGFISKYLHTQSQQIKYGLTQNVGGTGGTVIVNIIERGEL